MLFPTYAGLLNFGKSPQFFLSEAMIIVSHFRGIEGRDAIASIDCEGTLINQFHQAHHFILSRLSKSFSISGMVREEKLEMTNVLERGRAAIVIHGALHQLFVGTAEAVEFRGVDAIGQVKPEGADWSAIADTGAYGVDCVVEIGHAVLVEAEGHIAELVKHVAHVMKKHSADILA